MPAPSKPQLAIYAAFVVAVLLIGARFLREGGAGEPVGGGDVGAFASTVGEARGGASGGSAAASEAGEEEGASVGVLVVDVKGAVRRPGVYRLPAGARALNAVRRAGGLTRRADRVGVNLAARVVDGGEVVVPEAGSGGRAAGGASSHGGGPDGGTANAPLSLDLNTATVQALEQLDGVGPATAAKIVAWRMQHGGITSVDQLDEVPGIGPAKLAAIRAQLGG